MNEKIKRKIRFYSLLTSAFILIISIELIIVSAFSRYSSDINVYSLSIPKSALNFFEFSSDIPKLIYESSKELRAAISNDPLFLIESRDKIEKIHWLRKFPAPLDSGYLLLSATDEKIRASTIRLIRISDGAVVARWAPNWKDIYSKLNKNEINKRGSRFRIHAQHSMLLASGELVFQTGDQVGSLIKMTACGDNLIWTLDAGIHHSIENDSENNFIAPSKSIEPFTDYPILQNQISDDSIAMIDKDGLIIKKISFTKILLDNDMKWLIFGSAGPRLDRDLIHMNQINAAQHDSKFWKKGDLLISARHLSTVFLYRPSTNKIIWFKTGPWIGQHDSAFLDDHRISVFDNNALTFAPTKYSFLKTSDTNRVMIYDFMTDKIYEPYAELLAHARPITRTQGRARILPDGGLFLEETNNGRHLRFTKDKLLWSRVNDYDDKRIGLVFWSRYMTAEEVEKPLKALTEKGCAFPQ